MSDLVSRAPLAELQRYSRRMGWRVPWFGIELALDETDRVVGRALALERRDNDLPLALRKVTQLLHKCLKILRLHEIAAGRRPHDRGSSYLICELGHARYDLKKHSWRKTRRKIST